MRSFRWWTVMGALSLPGLVLAQAPAPREGTARERADRISQSCRDLRESCKQFERGSPSAQTCREAVDSCQQAERAAREQAKAEYQAAQQTQGVDFGIGGSLQEAGEALQGRPAPQPRGTLGSGKEVGNSITIDPIGFFIGEGVNATYWRPVSPKVTLLGTVRYTRVDIRENGSATSAGVTLGGDYFMIGAHNEGFRIGPRVEAGVGGETFGESDVSGSLGLAGELGYNWIAANGITAGVGAGLRGRVAGSTLSGDRPSSAAFGPYGRLNLGYSW